MIQHHNVDVNGVQMQYAEAPGPGAGLLFVHGTTGSHISFLPFMPALAAHAHVYALDLPGHGLSGRTPDAYQLPDYGRLVTGFVQTVIGQPTIIVGHSMGALVAAWVAGHAPDDVDGIFLEDPPIYLTQFPRFKETGFHAYFSHLLEYLTAHHARHGTLAEMVDYVSQAPVNEKGQTLMDIGGPEQVKERAQQIHQLDPQTLAPAVDGTLLGDEEPDALLARVRCPVRLLAADWDAGGALDAQDVERAVANLNQCKVITFPGAGHTLHLERPTEYGETLLAFVAE
jgi:pimeloyl-ACP methyl ester carboxylesterase